MDARRTLVLIGATAALAALVFVAGIVYLHRTDGRPRVCSTPAAASPSPSMVAADVPQRAPHLSTPAPC